VVGGSIRESGLVVSRYHGQLFQMNVGIVSYVCCKSGSCIARVAAEPTYRDPFEAAAKAGGKGRVHGPCMGRVVGTHVGSMFSLLLPPSQKERCFRIQKLSKKNDVLLNLACLHVHVGMQQSIST
jgi:hypothetical protein